MTYYDILLPVEQLFQESGNDMPATEHMKEPTTTPSKHEDIIQSKDKLFFIKFTPDRTMRPRWYLVQVDLQSTEEINPTAQENGKYWCMFLAKHPGDKKKSDKFSRWWPEWYRYTRCKDTNDVVYGDRILIRPSTNPDSTKFVQWAMELSLIGHTQHNLSGPFDFEEINSSNRMRQKVSRSEWTRLKEACSMNSMLPPTFGSNNNQPIETLKRTKTRKRKNSQ